MSNGTDSNIVPVVIKKNGRKAPLVVPKKVHLQNKDQKIVWYVIDGEIGTITFKKSSRLKDKPKKNLPKVQGKRREKELRVEKEGTYKGEHKYSFEFYPYDENGKSISVDPIAVIEY